MRCFKLLGERVMARDFDRQVAELQARAAILNRFPRLGTPTTVAMAELRQEKGGLRPEFSCVTKPVCQINAALLQHLVARYFSSAAPTRAPRSIF